MTTSHFAELKEWASAADGAANAATGIDPETNEPLYTVTLGRPGTSHALQTAERLGLPAPIVRGGARPIAPERLQRRRARGRGRGGRARAAHELRESAAAERRGGRSGARQGAARGRGAPGRDRAGAVVGGRPSGNARWRRPRRSWPACRAELEELRAEIRAARKLERERGRAATPAAPEEGGRARPQARRGVGSRRSRLPRRSRELDEPLPLTAPLAAGDPVVAPDARRPGDDRRDRRRTRRRCSGGGGLRIRVPLDRLRPDRDAARPIEPAEPAVTVRAMIAERPAATRSTCAAGRPRRRARRCATSSTRRRSPGGTRCA